MFKVVKDHIKHHPNRKNYHIKWNSIDFKVFNDRYQVWFFLPTIQWVPWYWRHDGECIFCISWFNWNLAIGEWKNGPRKKK